MSTLVLLALALATGSDDPAWGGFRGNNGLGVASSSGIPASLDPEENAMWRVEVPTGYSSPVIAGSHLFLTGVEGTTLVTLCLDRGLGEEVWRRELKYDGQRVGMNSSAAPTPVTDGEHLFVLFHAFGLVAYDLKGEELWRQEIGPFEIPHGMSSSPLIVGDLVILQVDQDVGAYLVAYDKISGKEAWKVARPGVTHSYSTPAVYRPEEGPAQIIVSGSFQVRSYSAADGELIWWLDGSAWQTKAVPLVVGGRCFLNAYMVPSSEFGMPPMKASFAEELAERDADGDGLIGRGEWPGDMIQQAWFIFDLDGDEHLDEKDWKYMESSAHAVGGLFAIDLSGKGDVTESHVPWKFKDRRGLPDCPTPVLVNGTLFLIKEGGIFTSIDPETGDVAKQGRVAKSDQYFASPIAAAGRIVTASLGGQLRVIQADREWEVLSVCDLGEEIWSTPAIADDQVFVRTQEALWCFEDAVD